MRRMLLAVGLLTGVTLVGNDAVAPADPAIANQLAEMKQARSIDLAGRPATLFRSLTLPQLLAVRDNLLEDAPSPRQEDLLREVMFCWGRLDGSAAFAYAREHQAMSRSIAFGRT